MIPNREAITALRELSGHSKSRFAEQVGLSVSHLSEIESGNGKYKGISPEAASRIAAALHVPVAAIAYPSNAPDPDEVAA